jgi:hypothetical protein
VLAQEVRAEGDREEGAEEEVQRVEVLTCQGDCRRVVVMVLVEVRVEVARVGQAMEEVEGEVFAEEKEDEGPKEPERIWNVLKLEAKGLLPIAEVQVQVYQSRDPDNVVQEYQEQRTLHQLNPFSSVIFPWPRLLIDFVLLNPW